MNRDRIVLIGLCLVYFVALSTSYALVESQLYDSIGMEYFPPRPSTQLLAAFMAIIPSLWLPIVARRPSQVCVWMVYITIVVPMMFVPYHVLRGTNEEIMVLPISILGLFLLLQFSLQMPLFRLPAVRVNRRAVYWGLQIGLVMLTVLVIVLKGSFHLDLSLSNVYDRRFDARAEVGSGSLAAYAITTLSYSLAPVVLLLGFARRHYAVVGLAVLAFLFVFSYRATKTDLFMPVFLLSLYVMLQFDRIPFGLCISLAAVALVLISMGEYLGFGTATISGYLIRRQLIGPSLLTSYYWEFFTDQPFVYFTDKFYGSYFFSPQYNLPLARLIGYEYLGNAENNANTCFWASAYANVGYPGMVVVTILLAATLRLIDSIAINGELLIAASMAGLFGVQLSNGSLENCIITGGIAVTCMLLYILKTGSTAPPPLAYSGRQLSRGHLPNKSRRSWTV